tara:strand:- start:1383 stop:1898 length:516 start_codon:yes stop_codon:yes gene_type:complete
MDQLKVKAIKNIVNTYFNTNVDARNRSDRLVKARAICYKILKEECCMTYSFIAYSFQKNHATIMHAVKEIKWMFKSDKQMEKDYHNILALWLEEAADYVELKPTELKKQLNLLQEQNKMLNLSLIDVQEKCEELSKHAKKYKTVVDLIDKRVPEQRLKEVEVKINHIINGL